MKRFLLLALCALFSFNAAEARTLYVNANRPNNKGNGLSASKAKKTIQAAINIAKKGDTILVYPGTYAPIKTKNKKITVKGVYGPVLTKIECVGFGTALDLGMGTASKVFGFEVKAIRNKDMYFRQTVATNGGTVRQCVFTQFGDMIAIGLSTPTFDKTNMTECDLLYCSPDSRGSFMNGCTLQRCVLHECGDPTSAAAIKSSNLFNSLIHDGRNLSFNSCLLINCTLAGNEKILLKRTNAYNSIFNGVASSQFKKARKNTVSHCYKGSAPKFRSFPASSAARWQYWSWHYRSWHFDGVPDEYEGQPVDYRLQASSPCIDKGKLTAAQKKLVGSKDLAGKKRIRGKAVDCGCYEF